jgi:hypothetical protein
MTLDLPTMSASVRLFDMLHGSEAGKHAATLGVDVQASLPAPGGECIWIDYGANDDLALALDVALESLSLFFPFVEAGRQSVSVRHDRANARIVLTSIPRHPDGGGDIEGTGEILFGHDFSSDGCLTASIEGVPPGESQGLSGGRPQPSKANARRTPAQPLRSMPRSSAEGRAA